MKHVVGGCGCFSDAGEDHRAESQQKIFRIIIEQISAQRDELRAENKRLR